MVTATVTGRALVISVVPNIAIVNAGSPIEFISLIVRVLVIKKECHYVEAYFKLNSISNGKGVPDGVVKYW